MEQNFGLWDEEKDETRGEEQSDPGDVSEPRDVKDRSEAIGQSNRDDAEDEETEEQK